MAGSKQLVIVMLGWIFLYSDPSQSVWLQQSKLFSDKAQCEIERESQYARLGKLSFSYPKWTFLWWISPECEAK